MPLPHPRGLRGTPRARGRATSAARNSLSSASSSGKRDPSSARIVLTRVRAALAWTFLGLAATSAFAAALAAPRLAPPAGWLLLVPSGAFALVGLAFLASTRALRLERAPAALRLPDGRRLASEEVCAVWLLSTGARGRTASRWRVVLLTAAAPPLLTDSLREAAERLSAGERAPLERALTDARARAALRAIASEALHPLLETPWERAARDLALRLSAHLRAPLLETAPPAPPSLAAPP